MTPDARPDPHTRTRLALQAVAEHLLAADLHRHTGRIGLRVTPGGFGQPELTVDGDRRRLRVEGTSLVVLRGDTETWHPLHTLGSAAAVAGVEPGAPTEVFTPGTPLEPDAPLELDEDAAAALADWFSLVGTALDALRRGNAGRSPTIAQLWPEHFDLAATISEVNFGGSPGDGAHPSPYLYVGPWEPREGAFWNAPFGALLAASEVRDPGDALAFFTEGLAAATA